MVIKFETDLEMCMKVTRYLMQVHTYVIYVVHVSEFKLYKCIM